MFVGSIRSYLFQGNPEIKLIGIEPLPVFREGIIRLGIQRHRNRQRITIALAYESEILISIELVAEIDRRSPPFVLVCELVLAVNQPARRLYGSRIPHCRGIRIPGLPHMGDNRRICNQSHVHRIRFRLRFRLRAGFRLDRLRIAAAQSGEKP